MSAPTEFDIAGDLAAGLFTDWGRDVTVVRAKADVNPETGDVFETLDETVVRAVLARLSRRDIELLDSPVESGDRAVYVPTEDLPGAPASDWRVAVADRAYRVIGSDLRAEDALTVLFVREET